MKKTALALITLISSFAFAHIELGTYVGVQQDRSACSFEVKSVGFKDNIRHPLQERVVIVAQDVTFELAHRPMLEPATRSVTGEKEILTGAQGAVQAAWGARLTMGENAEGEHGPQELVLIYDNYKKDDADQMIVCSELKHQK